MAGPKGSGGPDPPQPERDTQTAATQISVKVGKPLAEMSFPPPQTSRAKWRTLPGGVGPLQADSLRLDSAAGKPASDYN